MEFCSCGKLLNFHPKGELTLYCSKCKKKSESPEKKLMNYKTSSSSYLKSDRRDGIIVIDRKLQKLKTFPLVDFDCPKCKGKKAETWKLDFGSEDNSQAVFFRCISCGHTIRETD